MVKALSSGNETNETVGEEGMKSSGEDLKKTSSGESNDTGQRRTVLQGLAGSGPVDADDPAAKGIRPIGRWGGVLSAEVMLVDPGIGAAKRSRTVAVFKVIYSTAEDKSRRQTAVDALAAMLMCCEDVLIDATKPIFKETNVGRSSVTPPVGPAVHPNDYLTGIVDWVSGNGAKQLALEEEKEDGDETLQLVRANMPRFIAQQKAAVRKPDSRRVVLRGVPPAQQLSLYHSAHSSGGGSHGGSGKFKTQQVRVQLPSAPAPEPAEHV